MPAVSSALINDSEKIKIELIKTNNLNFFITASILNKFSLNMSLRLVMNDYKENYIKVKNPVQQISVQIINFYYLPSAYIH